MALPVSSRLELHLGFCLASLGLLGGRCMCPDLACRGFSDKPVYGRSRQQHARACSICGRCLPETDTVSGSSLWQSLGVRQWLFKYDWETPMQSPESVVLFSFPLQGAAIAKFSARLLPTIRLQCRGRGPYRKCIFECGRWDDMHGYGAAMWPKRE